MQQALAKPFAVQPQTRVSQRRAVTVCAVQKDAQPAASLKLMAASLAATSALLLGVPQADAGVILTQPETKKVFVDDGKPKDAPKAAAAAAKSKAPSASFQSGAPDFKTFVLPASLVAIAGGAFVIGKVDPGFNEMMVEASAKDSRSYAGYETALKDTPFYGGSGSIPSRAGTGPSGKAGTKGTGTTKKAAGTKKGLFGK